MDKYSFLIAGDRTRILDDGVALSGPWPAQASCRRGRARQESDAIFGDGREDRRETPTHAHTLSHTHSHACMHTL